VKLPIPEPMFMITLTHPSPRIRRTGMIALRFLLWLAVDWTLATADGGHHALWLAITVIYAVLAITVLTVDVVEGVGGEETP
jgi:hypothetical protein